MFFSGNTQEDAARIVSYSKYPPQGSRGYGPLFTPHAFPGVAPGPQYDDHANGNLQVIVQLESRSGVENVEKIAAVDGVDVLFIGELGPTAHLFGVFCLPGTSQAREGKRGQKGEAER